MYSNIKLKSEFNLKKKTPLSQIIKRGYRTLLVVLVVLILVLMALYMVVKNWSAQQGYILSQEQTIGEEYEHLNRDIEKEVTRTKSLDNIENREAVKDMQRRYEINYVKGGTSVSVVRE